MTTTQNIDLCNGNVSKQKQGSETGRKLIQSKWSSKGTVWKVHVHVYLSLGFELQYEKKNPRESQFATSIS